MAGTAVSSICLSGFRPDWGKGAADQKISGLSCGGAVICAEVLCMDAESSASIFAGAWDERFDPGVMFTEEDPVLRYKYLIKKKDRKVGKEYGKTCNATRLC